MFNKEELLGPGYEIKPDPDQQGLFLWQNDTEGSEISYTSEEEATAAATADAKEMFVEVIRSKQVSAKELAEIVTRLLTDTQTTGELDGFETFQGFMTDIAQVVCDYCGGEVHHPADSLDDIWYVGIHGNASLPDAFGGIWREYDKDGELFAEGTPEWFKSKYDQEHPEWPLTDWQYEIGNGDSTRGYWDWVAHNVESEAHNQSTCSECGEQIESIIGCPDGGEICQQCFDAGRH